MREQDWEPKKITLSGGPLSTMVASVRGSGPWWFLSKPPTMLQTGAARDMVTTIGVSEYAVDPRVGPDIAVYQRRVK